MSVILYVVVSFKANLCKKIEIIEVLFE
jgi:hypothetical protein